MSEENEFVSKDGVTFGSPTQYLFSGILKGCGCGNSIEIAADVWNLFDKIASDFPDKVKLVYSDKYHELIAHMLDAAGLLEHGSGIGGSWLSSKGREVYDEIKAALPKYANGDATA